MEAEIVSGQYDGDTPAHTPELMLSGIARYDSAQSFSGYRPFAQIDTSYQDDVQFILANHPGASEDAYTLLNLRLGVRSDDERWEVALWARNLTDKLYRTEVFGPGSGFLPGRIHYGPPRIYGLSASYNW
jgi:iron complex outermembrane receptor protein